MSATTRLKARIRTGARSVLGLEEITARLDRQLARIEETERELARIGPQVAALEARLETLRQRLEEGTAPALPEDEVRSIRAELERQHEQVRARISAAVRYEERLRRVEDALDTQGRVAPDTR